MKTNSSKDVLGAEPAWNVLRHNHQHTKEPKRRHKPYAGRLGLGLTAFPADNQEWKGDVGKMLDGLPPDGVQHSDNDIRYARLYLPHSWRWAEVSIADFVSKVAVGWGSVGPHAPLTDQALATVLKDEYVDEERQGHRNLVALLDARQRFEPVVVVATSSGLAVIHEGRHRHLAAYDWTRKNHDEGVYVELYYPRADAQRLGLP